jgi:lipopolysaccharide export system permease protein
MNRLGFYLFRQLMLAYVFSAAAVTFVILFTQSFRLLALVIDNSATLWIFFELMGLSIPTFLPLVLPLALGLAVIFVYNKLAVDSELVVMRAAGISPTRLARPALALTGIAVFVCYVLTLWITPAANSELVTLQYKIRDNYAVFLSHPGNFNDVTDGLTFYVRKRGTGGALEGILIHDVRVLQKPVTIMANTGQVVDNNGLPQIIVFNGRRQEMDIVTGKLSELLFDQYVLDLNALRSSSGPRVPDPREQTLYELIYPDKETLHGHATLERRLAELHQRFASPLLALAYTLIGLAAILAGEFNRRGMGKRMLTAGVAIIIVQAGFMSMNSAIARQPWLAFLLYLVPLTPVVAGFVLLGFDYNLRRTSLYSTTKAVTT